MAVASIAEGGGLRCLEQGGGGGGGVVAALGCVADGVGDSDLRP